MSSQKVPPDNTAQQIQPASCLDLEKLRICLVIMATISGIPGLLQEGKNKRKTLEFGRFSAFTNISEETVAVLISINVHLMLFFNLTVNLNPCLREHACVSALTQHPSSANTQLLRQDP